MKKSIKLLFWIILLIPCLGVERCHGSDCKDMDPVSEQQSVYWYEHGIKKRAWMALDEIAVFPKKGEDPELVGDLLIQQFQPQTAPDLRVMGLATTPTALAALRLPLPWSPASSPL